jgi:hypothetical protein
MPTKVSYPYDSFDSETVFSVFTQKSFIEKKYESVGATHLEFIDFGEKNGEYIIHTKRNITAEIPGFAKKFIKPTSTIIQTEIWQLSNDSIKKGTVVVEAKGLPMKMTGDIVLQPTDNGSENILVYEIKVNIPFVGSQIARFLDAEGRKTADKEYEFAINYLKHM